MDTRMGVLFIVLLFVVITIFTLIMLKSYQRRVSFIHPGWILVIVNSLYGLFVPVAYILLGDNLYQVYVGVARYFNSTNFIKIIWMYLIISTSFLYSQGLISLASKIYPNNINVNKRIDTNSDFKQINRLAIKIISSVLFIVGVYLIYLRFSVSGGLLSAFSVSRRDLAANLADSGVFTRYEYFLQPFFIISLLYILKIEKYKKLKLRRERFFFRFTLLTYIMYLFLVGIRLNIIVLTLGLFYILYTNSIIIMNKEKAKLFISQFWRNHKRAILRLMVVVFIVFGWYTYQRTNIRDAVLGETIKFNTVSFLSLLFPSEFATGYTPGLIILNNGFTDLGTTYWQKFIPSSVLSLIGITSNSTVSKDLAWRLHGIGRSAVYTITLPIDIYTATKSYFMIFIIGCVIYISFWLLFEKLSKKDFWGNCILAIVFLNLFYIIRVEAANWFPRIWQGTLIILIIRIIYTVLNKVKIIKR